MTGAARHTTHEVLNQVPPLVGYDVAEDAALLAALSREGAGWAEPGLHELGILAGSAATQEQARLAPVLPELVALGVPVSIDTLKAAVAAWALDQGAAIVNDVWGLQGDPDMAHIVAERGVPVIIMHNREAADPAIDIIADVTAFFHRSLDIAARAGIARTGGRSRRPGGPPATRRRCRPGPGFRVPH